MVLAAGASAIVVGWLARLVVPPTRRLAGRVRPYAAPARAGLGRGADVRAVAGGDPLTIGGPAVWQVLRPLLEAVAGAVGRLLGRGDDDHTLRRLRQAGLLGDVPEERRVQELRLQQVARALGYGALGLLAGVSLGLTGAAVVSLGALGAAVGPLRLQGRIDRRIEARRTRLRMELYTVNQLLAMHVRVGGGVVQAMRRIVSRGEGELVGELREILVAHESGVPLRDAFRHAAERTAEPFAARTYRLLATGAELGTDLADALLAHSEDVHEARREAMKRAATRRRAAMLVPIIAVLAPVMLLFVAAPLPSIVLGVH